MKKIFAALLIGLGSLSILQAANAASATVTLGTGVNLTVTGNLSVGAFGDASAITVGSSPFTYTNTTTQKQMVTVSGGTVSAVTITRNGGTTVATGVVAGTFLLAPTDSLIVTDTVSPTMTLIPE